MNSKNLLAISITAVAVFLASPKMANAQSTFDQKQKQELEIVCETGSYGQNVNCRAKGTQEQSQNATLTNTVIYRNGRALPAHKVVNTGVDSNVAALAFGVVAIAFLALALKLKFRV